MKFGLKNLTITEQHIKLLDQMYIGWEDCEFGAPAVDCKRPYGNSDVYGDIGEILEIKPDGKSKYEDEYSEEQQRDFLDLHLEMQDVLQILVQHPTEGLRVGRTYKREDYKHWKLVD